MRQFFRYNQEVMLNVPTCTKHMIPKSQKGLQRLSNFPQIIYLIHGNRRQNMRSKTRKEQGDKGGWKKVQLKTSDCGPGGKSQDSSDSSKDFVDQCQHHTSNESAAHARLTITKILAYSSVPSSSLKLWMWVLISNNEVNSEGDWRLAEHIVVALNIRYKI